MGPEVITKVNGVGTVTPPEPEQDNDGDKSAL